MTESTNIPQTGTKKPEEKPMVLKIVRIVILCIISLMGLGVSCVLLFAYGWIVGAVSLVIFTGLAFLANFIVVKLLPSFDLGGGVEHIGVLTKKWSLQETVTRGSGDLYYGDVYYVMLNERMFKIGDNRHGRGWQQYESLQLNKTYKLKESSLVSGFIVSIEEVIVETKNRSTGLNF